MLAVVDTSTIIRGFMVSRFPEPKYIIDLMKTRQLQLAMYDEMAKELAIALTDVLEENNIDPRPYLRDIAVFTLNALRVEPRYCFASCRDNTDNIFISCAIDAEVDFVISSDREIFNIKQAISSDLKRFLPGTEKYNTLLQKRSRKPTVSIVG